MNFVFVFGVLNLGLQVVFQPDWFSVTWFLVFLFCINDTTLMMWIVAYTFFIEKYQYFIIGMGAVANTAWLIVEFMMKNF